MGGVDLGYWLKCKWPDDEAILHALAVEIRTQRDREMKNLAHEIASRVMEGLDKAFG
jgi:hypothetical protein